MSKRAQCRPPLTVMHIVRQGLRLLPILVSNINGDSCSLIDPGPYTWYLNGTGLDKGVFPAGFHEVIFESKFVFAVPNRDTRCIYGAGFMLSVAYPVEMLSDYAGTSRIEQALFG